MRGCICDVLRRLTLWVWLCKRRLGVCGRGNTVERVVVEMKERPYIKLGPNVRYTSTGQKSQRKSDLVKERGRDREYRNHQNLFDSVPYRSVV